MLLDEAGQLAAILLLGGAVQSSVHVKLSLAQEVRPDELGEGDRLRCGCFPRLGPTL